MKKINYSRRLISLFGLWMGVLALFVAGVTLLMPHNTYAAGASGGNISVGIDDAGLHPVEISIASGTQIEWRNNSNALTHKLVFSDGTSSPVLARHDKYVRAFNTAGVFTYTSTNPNQVGTVRVTSDSGGGHDRAKLKVSSSHDALIAPGAIVTYHITYENDSDDVVAQNVLLTVTLPASSTLLSSRKHQGGVFTPTTQLSNTLVYSLGNMAIQSEGELDLQVQFSSALPVDADVSLMANVSADNVNEADGSHTEDHHKVAAPQLTLNIRPKDEHGDSAAFLPGGLVTYTLEYANHSDEAAAHAVTISLQLPPVVRFVSARKDDGSGQPTVTNIISGNTVLFFVGTLAPEASGRIYAQLRLSDVITTGQHLELTGRIDSADSPNSVGHNDDGRVISDTQTVLPDATNLYVRLTSTSDAVISGTQTYHVFFGNTGTHKAENVRVRLNLPSGIVAVNFGKNSPTSFISNTAVWNIGTLDKRTDAQPFVISGTIRDAGQLTATASISGTSDAPEANEHDNEATESEKIEPILRPVIVSPRRAIVGTLPVIRGFGYSRYYYSVIKSSDVATVSVYLSGTQTISGYLMGSATVLSNGLWTVTPTVPLSVGWHWITATMTVNGQTSGATGASFVVSNTLNIDPDSVTRDDIKIGGLNAKLGWAPGHTYKIGMKITACATPLTPTLQALFFNSAGLMTGFKNFTPTLAQVGTGQVAFNFTPPTATPFELYVDYYCPLAALNQAALAPEITNAGLNHLHDCFAAPGCSDDPPDPPEHCEDCLPEKPQRPIAIDPEGFVFDAASVNAGATMTQAIITQAWVTITQRTPSGLFAPWDGQSLNQSNPQYTDSVYPDKVLIPGYYSFLVQPGEYRVHVSAAGYAAYESSIIRIVDSPVTLNVGLERAQGTLVSVGAVASAKARVFLPLLHR